MESSLEEKQLFLRTEIIMNGYDAEEFMIYLQNIKGEENVDLEYWSLDDIQKAVESFKQLKLLQKNKALEKKKTKKEKVVKETKEEEQKEIKEEKVEKQEDVNEDSKKIKKKKFRFFRNILKKNCCILETEEDNLNKEKIKDNEGTTIKDNKKDNENKEKNPLNLIKIECEKLEKNELTNIKDLNVKVSCSTQIKNNKTLNTINFNIETNPVKFKTERKLDDFEYVYQKLSFINPYIFNPILPMHLKKDLDSQIIYLNVYLNSLLQIPNFRSLPIIYDFLNLSQENWEKAKLEKYDKIKDPYPRNLVQNLEGYFLFKDKISKKEKENFLKIKDFMNIKNEAFNKVNNIIQDLLNIMEKMGNTIKNLHESFEQLKNAYNNDKGCLNSFAYFEIIFREWGQGYMKQRKYFNDELKYFFKYMDRENNAFIKYYDNYKNNYDSLKSKIEKIKKNNNVTEKEKETLKSLFNEIAFNIYNTNAEYKSLNNRQNERIDNLLFQFGQEKRTIFNDIHSFLSLLNVFEEKKKVEKKKEEKKEKEEK